MIKVPADVQRHLAIGLALGSAGASLLMAIRGQDVPALIASVIAFALLWISKLFRE